MKYIINGGEKLEGEVIVSGNKNAVFPCMAAALLTSDEVILENIPNLSDTRVYIEILKTLGVSIQKEGSRLILNASRAHNSTLPKELMSKLRGSVVLVGAILGRLGKVKFHHPGGDIIGQRSIETHLVGFKLLGGSIKRDDLEYTLKLDSKKDVKIFMEETSVTATENLILASVLGKRKVVLRNCAKEPHVVDLCKMLTKMGAKIQNIGTDNLEIRGVDKLHQTTYKIGCDFIEAGTYLIMGAITQGKIVIKGLDNADLDPLLEPLKGFNIKFKKTKDSIIVSQSNLKAILRLQTNIWPGFPTDLMSAAIVLATQARGATLCHDWMYEGRMFFVDKLISMGAKIVLADPHRCLVYGPANLRGRILETPDIRAGMALVLAALVARGKSVINQAELIERGYENVCEKLKACGAGIERVV